LVSLGRLESNGIIDLWTRSTVVSVHPFTDNFATMLLEEKKVGVASEMEVLT
jgi:hypothetical protein